MSSILVKPGFNKGKILLSLIMICIIGVISSYVYVLAVYVSPLHEAHGWSMNTIVATYSIAMFCEPFAFIMGGALMNKIGRKKVLVGSGVIYGAAIALSGTTGSVVVFMICQGIICSLAMYGIFICQIALINVIWPEKKSTIMGIMYGCSTFGGALLAPAANFFIGAFSVSMALIIQGIIFMVVMFVCSLLIIDPTKGDKKLAEELDAESAAFDAENAGDMPERPGMGWKKVIKHPSLYLFMLSIILIQLIGNLLVTDASVLAEGTYGATATQAALCVSLLNIGAGFGGIICGILGDKLGHFKTTMLLGIFDGVCLLIMAGIGGHSLMAFMVIVFIQGFTYNGITALNPAMVTEAWGSQDLGTTMGITGIAIIIVAIIGPQLGLMVPFVPMLVLCAIASIIGGLLAIATVKSVNKYYKNIGSDVIVK